LPDEAAHIRNTIDAKLAAARATKAERELLHYDPVETANDRLVQTARAALALMEEREAEDEAKKQG
jgi:hypothetical protein